MKCSMFFAVLSMALVISVPVFAEQKKAPGDAAVAQALRKAQGMLQQLSEENERLEQRVKALDEQVGKLTAKAQQLDILAPELARQQSSTQSLRTQNSTLIERTNRDAAHIKELQDKFSLSQQDNELLVQAVLERSAWIDGCTAKNAELLQVNRELITRYNRKGIWQALKSAEPITQIGGVQEEVEAQSYRVKLDKLKVTQWQEGK